MQEYLRYQVAKTGEDSQHPTIISTRYFSRKQNSLILHIVHKSTLMSPTQRTKITQMDHLHL